MELQLPWFFRQPRNHAHAELIRIRAAQLKGWEYSPRLNYGRSIDAVCDLVSDEFRNSGCQREAAEEIVRATLDLTVQLALTEPMRRIKSKEAVITIKGITFPKSQIGQLRERLYQHLQKTSKLSYQAPNWEEIRQEAERRHREA